MECQNIPYGFELDFCQPLSPNGRIFRSNESGRFLKHMGTYPDSPVAVYRIACPLVFSRRCCHAVVLLCGLPSHPRIHLRTVAEGSYLWVNKTLIEFFYGADRWIKRWREEKAHAPIPTVKKEGVSLQRRDFLRDLISVPFLGAFAYAVYRKKKWDSFEEKFLTEKPDATSGATLRSFNFASLGDLKGQVPKGKIGDLELSRLIMGGNLIGVWAHARDLIYVSKLVKAYHTDEWVMMTFQLAEECGINTYMGNPQ